MSSSNFFFSWSVLPFICSLISLNIRALLVLTLLYPEVSMSFPIENFDQVSLSAAVESLALTMLGKKLALGFSWSYLFEWSISAFWTTYFLSESSTGTFFKISLTVARLISLTVELLFFLMRQYKQISKLATMSKMKIGRATRRIVSMGNSF